MLCLFSGQFAPSNLTGYVVNGRTLSVMWDLPANIDEIDKTYITVMELSATTNRTIQMQALDNTIKKLDLPIHPESPNSIQPNTTVQFSARTCNRYGQNSSTVDYQLHVNIWSKSSSSAVIFIGKHPLVSRRAEREEKVYY